VKQGRRAIHGKSDSKVKKASQVKEALQGKMRASWKTLRAMFEITNPI
jgi:hypothetical protein